MRGSVEIDSDSWSQVKDPKKRKQIQDRLAQRARRKRLAENRSQQQQQEHRQSHHRGQDIVPTAFQGALLNHQPEHLSRDNTGISTNKSSTPIRYGIITETSPRLSNIPVQPNFGQWSSSTTATTSTGPSTSTSSTTTTTNVTSTPPNIGTDQILLTRHVSSVFAALHNNGLILGLRCGIQVPILSPPCTAKVPLSLHPSKTQMTVLHIPWIDRFPFPGMRDNVIRLSGMFDEEEFLNDLYQTNTFTILSESVSWDPGAWIMTKSFEEKWGFLFY
ncbi:hypothetical protein H2204_000890 [Knufia peltigerae]|uniref:Uncharacterized protein n=1 Tax=Knufia peltigerae TaxID=1002370 RepID=A0AA38YFV3_9EURO|nr:hypothetical protein H2204_000890 [Knufia peltigerae]